MTNFDKVRHYHRNFNEDEHLQWDATGRFSNMVDVGFQEGCYAQSGEMDSLFAYHGFERQIIRSIRGFAYEREEAICSLEDQAAKEQAFELIEATAARREIVETCGHAVYIGKEM